MCYPCTQCGRCGKYKEDSPYYTPPASIPCFTCGGEVDGETGVCTSCGAVAFAPVGTRQERSTEGRSAEERSAKACV